MPSAVPGSHLNLLQEKFSVFEILPFLLLLVLSVLWLFLIENPNQRFFVLERRMFVINHHRTTLKNHIPDSV